MPTITLTVDAQQGQRILAVFTRMLRRQATLEDVKSYLIGRIREVVIQNEREAAVDAANLEDLGPIS